LGETALRIFNCQLGAARQKQKGINKEQNTAGAIKKLSKISASADGSVFAKSSGQCQPGSRRSRRSRSISCPRISLPQLVIQNRGGFKNYY